MNLRGSFSVGELAEVTEMASLTQSRFPWGPCPPGPCGDVRLRSIDDVSHTRSTWRSSRATPTTSSARRKFPETARFRPAHAAKTNKFGSSDRVWARRGVAAIETASRSQSLGRRHNWYSGDHPRNTAQLSHDEHLAGGAGFRCTVRLHAGGSIRSRELHRPDLAGTPP